MDILLSTRLLGYLGLVYVLVVAFFALIESSIPVMFLVIALGALVLVLLWTVRAQYFKRREQSQRPSSF